MAESTAEPQRRVSEVISTLSAALVTAIRSGESFRITAAQDDAARLFYSMVANNDELSAAAKREIISTKLLSRVTRALVAKESGLSVSEIASSVIAGHSGSVTTTTASTSGTGSSISDSGGSPTTKRKSATAEALSAVSREPWTVDYRISAAIVDDDEEDEDDYEDESDDSGDGDRTKLKTTDLTKTGGTADAATIDESDLSPPAGTTTVTCPRPDGISRKSDDLILGDSYDSSVDALIVSKTEGGLVTTAEDGASAETTPDQSSPETDDKSGTIKSISSSMDESSADAISDFEKIDIVNQASTKSHSDEDPQQQQNTNDEDDKDIPPPPLLSVPKKSGKKRKTLKPGMDEHEILMKDAVGVSVGISGDGSGGSEGSDQRSDQPLFDENLCEIYLTEPKQVRSSLMSGALVGLSSGSSDNTVALVSVGRAEENDIITDSVFSGVSRFHGYLMRTDSALLWVDLWSRFGSTLVYRSDPLKTLFASEPGSRHVIVLGKDETALIRLADECDLLVNPAPCFPCDKFYGKSGARLKIESPRLGTVKEIMSDDTTIIDT